MNLDCWGGGDEEGEHIGTIDGVIGSFSEFQELDFNILRTEVDFLSYIQPEILEGSHEGEAVAATVTADELEGGDEAVVDEDGWWPSFPVSSDLASRLQAFRHAMISEPAGLSTGAVLESADSSDQSAWSQPMFPALVPEGQTDQSSSPSQDSTPLPSDELEVKQPQTASPR